MSLHPLPLSQLDQAAALMAAAFHDYPLTAWLYPQEDDRRRRLTSFFTGALGMTSLDGQVWVTEELDGACAFLRPGQPAFSLSALARMTWRRPGLWLRTGLGPLWRNEHLLRYDEARRHRLCPGPHYYYMLLAVSPSSGGRGLGSHLISEVLAQADDESVPTYCETYSAALARVYERFGFEEVEHGPVPGTPLESWAMIRPAPVG